jgi:Zn-dependent protease with chaperone function
MIDAAIRPQHALLARVDLKSAYKLNPSTNTGVADIFGQPAQLINTLLPNIFVAAGLVILFLFVFGGLSIILAGGDEKGVEKGRQAITAAIIGFVIIFSSYWIVQIIQVMTGVQILNTAL